MKPFAVLKSPSPNYSAVVIATGSSVPHGNLEILAQELRRGGFVGAVIFDLLTANGTRKRRFYTLGFDGTRFSPSTCFEHVEPEASVRTASTEYLHLHASELDLSLLNSAMKFAVERGLPV